MLVLGDVEAFDLAVGGARRDHRNLALERHEGLEDRRSGAELVPELAEIAAVADHGLALAVIAEAAGLEHGGRPIVAIAARRVSGEDDGGKVGRADAEPGHEILLDQPVLRGRQHFWAGSTGLRAARNIAVSAGTFSNS